MNFKSGSLFFLVSAILMTMAFLMFVSAPNLVMSGKKKRFIRHKKRHSRKKPYFDRDILRAKQRKWHPNYHLPDVKNNLGKFLPHHPHHAL